MYTFIMGYYSNIKELNLPFTTTWMDLEVIMLSEIRWRKTNTICYHIYVKSKKKTENNRKKLQTT